MSTNGIFTRKRLIERLEAMAGIAAGILTIGNIWYVSSVNGVSGYTGASPDKAVPTVTAALALATAGNNDIIICDSDHAETIGSAGAITIAKAGIQIIGTGTGRNRTTFTWATSTAATIVVSAAGVRFSNCVFIGTGVDAVVTMFSCATCDGLQFDNCEFDIANATNQAALGITLTGVNYFKFLDNHVHGTLNAGCTNFIQCVGTAGNQLDYVIARNKVIAAFTTSLGFFNNITVAMVNAVFSDNHIVNTTASATKCIVCLTASTGLAMNNRFGIGSGAAPITMDAGWWSGNWSTAAVATNGTLV